MALFFASRRTQSRSPNNNMDDQDIVAPVEGVEAEEEVTEAPAEETLPTEEAGEEEAA